MARKQKLTRDVALRTALQSNSQRQLAKKLGVSPRTVGRWLRGESAPREPGRIMRKLAPIHYHTARKIAEANATYTGDDAISPPKTAIPIVGDRKLIHERDAYGDKTGRMRYSDWVNYDVKYLDTAAIFDALRAIRDAAGERGRGLQLVYRVKRGHYSIYRRQKIDASEREGTKLFEVYAGMSDETLWRISLAPLVAADAHILFIAVLER